MDVFRWSLALENIKESYFSLDVHLYLYFIISCWILNTVLIYRLIFCTFFFLSYFWRGFYEDFFCLTTLFNIPCNLYFLSSLHGTFFIQRWMGVKWERVPSCVVMMQWLWRLLVCFLDPASGGDLELRVRDLVGYGAQIPATHLVVELCKFFKGNLWQTLDGKANPWWYT